MGKIDEVFEYVELCLDSADAITSGDLVFKNPGNDFLPALSSYSWPLFSITSKKWQVAAIKVLEASIPYQYNNINNGNNSLVYIDTGVSYNIRIPEGVYNSGASIAAILQTAIQMVRPGFSVSYSTTTQKFTFTPPGAFAWSLVFNNRSTAYSVLGFLVGTYSNVGGSIESLRYAEWYGSKYLYLNSRTIGPLINFVLSDNSPSGGLGNQIAKIPIEIETVSNLGFINYKDENPENFFDFFALNQFDSLDLYLTPGPSEGQVPLDMRGHSWSVKLGLLVYRDATANIKEKPTFQKIIK